MPNISTVTRRRTYIAKGSREVMDVIRNAMKIEKISLERMAAAWDVSEQTVDNRAKKPEFLRLYEIITAMEVAGIDEITIKLK